MIPEYLDRNCMIYQQDWLTFLGALSPESIQLIWTRPPSESDGQRSAGALKSMAQMEDVELCAAVADAATRVLTQDGLFVVTIDAILVEDVIAAINKRTQLQLVGEIVSTDATATVFCKSMTDSEPFWLVLDTTIERSIAPFIEANTQPGDAVVDPFCGSGAVLEAAVNSDCVAVVNDISPEAVEAAVNRYKERCAR